MVTDEKIEDERTRARAWHSRALESKATAMDFNLAL